jgi:hypothetical protein
MLTEIPFTVQVTRGSHDAMLASLSGGVGVSHVMDSRVNRIHAREYIAIL